MSSFQVSYLLKRNKKKHKNRFKKDVCRKINLPSVFKYVIFFKQIKKNERRDVNPRLRDFALFSFVNIDGDSARAPRPLKTPSDEDIKITLMCAHFGVAAHRHDLHTRRSRAAKCV